MTKYHKSNKRRTQNKTDKSTVRENVSISTCILYMYKFDANCTVVKRKTNIY